MSQMKPCCKKGLTLKESIIRCLQYIGPKMKSMPLSSSMPQQTWEEFLVISTVRNPFTRLSSGYHYVSQMLTGGRSDCNFPTFKEFCRQELVNQANTFLSLGDCIAKVSRVLICPCPGIQQYWCWCHNKIVLASIKDLQI
jgi:hypothetical protein